MQYLISFRLITGISIYFTYSFKSLFNELFYHFQKEVGQQAKKYYIFVFVFPKSIERIVKSDF